VRSNEARATINFLLLYQGSSPFTHCATSAGCCATSAGSAPPVLVLRHPGAVVAVDMAKAFDTFSHGFLPEVFKFFHFGHYITNWLGLIGQNRTACIIVDDSTYSKNFNLGRGRAQGDNISPNTFNFGEQILLFKIELDPRIRSVRAFGPPVQLKLTHNNPVFMCESQRETDKNESMADDNTTITWFETASLSALRENLDEFSRISGLQCNYDKTMVMPVGPVVGQNIDTAGFSICKKIKLLGLEICNANTDFNDSSFLGKIPSHSSWTNCCVQNSSNSADKLSG
jgi:hypothetical protein